MVKSYLKFEHSKTFAQICSASSNVIWEPSSEADGKASSGRAVVGANEEVLVWDLKKGELLDRWRAAEDNAQVTVIAHSRPDPDIFAVGYEDGKIRVWDSRTTTIIITFNGHKSAVTHLQFDATGVRLASGSRDTDIILWDLVAEVGLFRLRGHKDQITSLNFLTLPSSTVESSDNEDSADRYLLTTSKDSLIKLWDLQSQYCIETHVAQTNGECWALGISPDGTGCITAGNDGELRVWSIRTNHLSNSDPDANLGKSRILHDRGTIYRQGRDRTIAVRFHPKRDLLAVHGNEKAVELFRIRSEDEVRRSMARKRKRKRENTTATEKNGNHTVGADTGADGVDDVADALATDVIIPYVIVRTSGRVRSLDWAGGKSGKSVSVLVSTTNNQIEVYDVGLHDRKGLKGGENPEYVRSMSVDTPGHRSDIRCLALSSDDRMLASASHGSLKIWNVRTQSCLRTLDCGYALCTAFLPGDKIVVIGTREGTLEVFDIASSTLINTIHGHDKDVWALHVSPDGKSLVTASADKSAKFWEFKVVQEEVLGTNRKSPKLTLVHTKTLKVADDILSVRFTPDSRLLALSTLDNTVKVFFSDSLKLFLTLYGHKLPVLSLDISYDSKLIVTSSADKTVRVWGLDFGDCHKTFLAHQDSILSVAFVPNNDEGNGHHFFSASKDRFIKYYDGDKFEQIQKLEGHHGEIWSMVVARSCEFVISSSHDKSIRVWQQTDEQIFLEEERERELEELYENTLLTSLEQDGNDANGDANQHEVADATKQTAQTLMAGEKIAEALELGIADLEIMREHEKSLELNPRSAPPSRHPIFLANNVPAAAYVLAVVEKIQAASLQDALLVLSFSQLPALFTFLSLWAAEGRHISLTCRILFFMVKSHQKQIVSSRLLKPLLEEVKANLRQTLRLQKQEMGFNVAGLRILTRRVEQLSASDYVDESMISTQAGTSHGTKRTYVNVA